MSGDIVSCASPLHRGQKVECPVCGKRVMYEAFRSFSGSGLGQHIKSAHPAEYPPIERAALARERAEALAKAAAEAEERERPLRTHMVTGALIDEIIGELRSLIDMMEPYYSQCGGGDDAEALIDRLDAIAKARGGAA